MKNVILTNYLTSRPDHHRGGIQWKADLSLINPLIESAAKFKIPVFILHDCFDLPNKYETIRNQYAQCWFNFRDFLREHNEIEKVFCVDATDVIVLKNPFEEMDEIMRDKNVDYFCGSEHQLVDCPWFRNCNTWHKEERDFLESHKFDILLNSGILGGKRKEVLNFAEKMTALYDHLGDTYGDMSMFNILMYKERFYTGAKVHTVFKKEETNDFSWFKHK